MSFPDEIIPPLRGLAKIFVDREMDSELATVADLLVEFQLGRWPDLSCDDQLVQLERMHQAFHPRLMGEGWVGALPEYNLVLSLINTEYRRVRLKRVDQAKHNT